MSIVVVLAAVLGLPVGHLATRAAGRFPWPSRLPSVRGPGRPAVRPPVLEITTAILFGLVAVRFGLSWQLPAYLALAAVAVLLAVIDLQHHLLPDRVVLPSLGIGVVLLALAALLDDRWPALLRAVLAAAALFMVFLVMALISPSGLGMGDVKLAALLGLHLGWLGWGAVVAGAVAAFVVQAVLALVLLLSRRVGLRGELPFGPALLLGSAVAIGWPALANGTAFLR